LVSIGLVLSEEKIFEKVFITNLLILEEQNSFKIIGTWAEQFSGMGNFVMTIWNPLIENGRAK
jgi:hypothetical protein